MIIRDQHRKPRNAISAWWPRILSFHHEQYNNIENDFVMGIGATRRGKSYLKDIPAENMNLERLFLIPVA